MSDDHDLVKRLRNYAACEVKVSIGEHEDICSQADDAIERLTKERDEAKLALKMLADDYHESENALDAEKLRHAMLFDDLTQDQTERDAAFTAGALAMREACATMLEHPNAGLEPPDGGSPTRQEMLANISAAIRTIDPKEMKG